MAERTKKQTEIIEGIRDTMKQEVELLRRKAALYQQAADVLSKEDMLKLLKVKV